MKNIDNTFTVRRQEQLDEEGFTGNDLFITEEMMKHSPDEGEWVRTDKGWTKEYTK